MVGEISNWPHGPSTRKSDWRLTAVMITIMLGVMGYILVVPEREDLSLLPRVTGCYLNREHRLAVIVDGRKLLRAEGLSVPVQIYDQKWGGVRLLPSRRLVYDPRLNRVVVVDGEPSFVVSDRFYGVLSMQGARYSDNADFTRVPCPNPATPAAHQ